MSFKITFTSAAVTLLFLVGFAVFINADVSHVVSSSGNLPVTEVCLGCICEAISGCNKASTCEGDVCGLFGITWPYWSDAGKPTVQGEDASSQTAYTHCVTEPYCAARTVQGYMQRYGQDCNGDGVINCYDHAAIHKLGGHGCNGDLPYTYFTKLDQCLRIVQQGRGEHNRIN